MERGAVRRKQDSLLIRRTRTSDEKQHVHQVNFHWSCEWAIALYVWFHHTFIMGVCVWLVSDSGWSLVYWEKLEASFLNVKTSNALKWSVDLSNFLSKRKCVHLIYAGVFFQLHTKSFELTKVIHLLEDPLTVSPALVLFHLTECFTSAVLTHFIYLKANLKERHLLTLKKLLKRSQIGFVSFSLNPRIWKSLQYNTSQTLTNRRCHTQQ